MNFNSLIPIALFICITYAIKAVDAQVRSRMVDSGGSQEMVNAIMRDEELRSRHSSLRWGIVLLFVGVGFGVIQWFGWKDLTPSMIAVLAGATALGNLLFFAIARRLN